jgi:predicted lipid-binding transport protein (Tim44 family)
MTSSQKNSSYWGQQIAACATLGVLLCGVGVGLMVNQPEEPGAGFILFVIGLAFLATLVWLARQYRKMSKEQRAVYAWAIEQQSSAQAGRTPGSDLTMMAIAGKAKDGGLSRSEIQQLQNLKPENPYPAPLPTPPAPTWSGPEL